MNRIEVIYYLFRGYAILISLKYKNMKQSSFYLLIFIFSNIFSVDNSDYMRNGDFLPTRLQAQQDAVNLVCHSKTRSNPENNVGLITLAKYVIPIFCTANIHAFIMELFYLLQCRSIGYPYQRCWKNSLKASSSST